MRARLLRFGVQISEIPAQRKFVSAMCEIPAQRKFVSVECNAHSNAHKPPKAVATSYAGQVCFSNVPRSYAAQVCFSRLPRILRSASLFQ